MTVYFTKHDDLILFHFNIKKLNMFNLLHIKMMKTSFEIIRGHCIILATTKNLHTCVCFYVNISLNKNKPSTVKLEDHLTRWLVKLKEMNSQKLLLMLGEEKNASGM